MDCATARRLGAVHSQLCGSPQRRHGTPSRPTAVQASVPAAAAGTTAPELIAPERLAGKVAIVTGVGPSTESGSIENIGLATARRLLQEGATVVATDVLDGAAAMAAAAQEAGGTAAERASFVPCDITDTAAVDALVAAVHEQHGSVDLLVCGPRH